ncbi:MAG: tetratricopeptide repeat protein [Chloroflexi bacterium]|nr:tetratricopeptide repeat protein [Chloroflexota bacterium]
MRARWLIPVVFLAAGLFIGYFIGNLSGKQNTVRVVYKPLAEMIFNAPKMPGPVKEWEDKASQALSGGDAGAILQYRLKELEAAKKTRASGELLSYIYQRLGEAQLVTGKYDEAETNLSRALSMAENNYSNDDPRLADILVTMGEVNRRADRMSKAAPFIERAMNIRLKQLGGSHPEIGRLANLLANTYKESGQPEKAEECYRMAMEVEKNRLEAGVPDVSKVLNGMGELHTDRGDSAGAEKFFMMALDEDRKDFHRVLMNITRDANDVGISVVAQGRVDEAEQALQFSMAALEAMEKTGMKPDIVYNFEVHLYLANIYILKDDYKKGLAELEEVRKLLGEKIGSKVREPFTENVIFGMMMKLVTEVTNTAIKKAADDPSSGKSLEVTLSRIRENVEKKNFEEADLQLKTLIGKLRKVLESEAGKG